MISKKTSIQVSDLRGLINLIADATVGVTDLTEDVHQQIVHPPLLPSTPIQHIITSIAGIAYYNVRTVAKLTGVGLDKLLSQINPQLDLGISIQKKEAIVSVLNGIIGDFLVKNNNPLAIPMQFRFQDEKLELKSLKKNKTYGEISGRIIIMVHGLCMDDQQWNAGGHNHGASIAQELKKTVLYLRYNSGLHISENGQSLNRHIEELVDSWPVPVTELVIIAHSMGGLVTKSAVHYGQQGKKSWTKLLKKIIFLGTPHHGTPLEQVGNYITQVLAAIPYLKPFARLAKIRSAGITDLRYGSIAEKDWSGFDRFRNKPDKRMPINFPANIQCYAIAGSLTKREDYFKAQIIGDGLVQLDSALGKHKNQLKTLHLSEKNKHIAYETSHMDLLKSEEVYNKIKSWLST